MTMNFDPKDDELARLLADYAAPVEDDGFTLSVIRKLEAKERLRAIWLGIAFLVAGLLIAFPLKALSGWLAGGTESLAASELSLSSLTPVMPERFADLSTTMGSLGVPMWSLLFLVAMGGWLVWDSLTA